MQTLSPRTLTLVACAACERPTPETELVPHPRGGGNYPLCTACANTLPQVACAVCGDPSPRSLLILGTCPCVPPYEVAALVQPFGPVEPLPDEEEARYQDWLQRRAEEADWH